MDDFDVQYVEMPATNVVKDFLEIRTMLVENGMETAMIDDSIRKEIYILAVSTDKTFRTVEAEYNKEQAKDKLSVVKPIK